MTAPEEQPLDPTATASTGGAAVRRGPSKAEWEAAPAPAPYDPLSKENLGRSVETALLTQAQQPLDSIEPFRGAGIYAIYYTGHLDYYRPLANSQTPIYVGRASTTGARKGKKPAADAGRELWTRLFQHAGSVMAANNLKIEDFRARYLVADALFIPLAETLMIQGFLPLWNLKLDGFGNHDPGSGRYNQKRSPWDTLHPGRTFADKLQPPQEDAAQAEAVVRAHLTDHPPVAANEPLLTPPPPSIPEAEVPVSDDDDAGDDLFSSLET